MRLASSNSGFTVLEILITIGLLIILLGIGGMYINEWRPSQTHIEAVEIVRDTIRIARINSDVGRNGKDWEIEFASTTITLKGDTDTVYPLPNNSILSWQGKNKIKFERPHGFPKSTKTITITTGSLSTTFDINEYGILEKQ